MLFKPSHSLSLLQGRLETRKGSSVIVDLEGRSYACAEVDFAIPDDEPQGAEIQAAGYPIHTPMSMNLGAGTTGV